MEQLLTVKYENVKIIDKIFENLHLAEYFGNIIYIKKEGDNNLFYKKLPIPEELKEYFYGNIRYDLFGETIVIYSIDEKMHKFLVIGDLIGHGVYGKIYEIRIIKKKLKHLNLVVKTPTKDKEIIIQNIVSKYNICPRVFGFWKTKVNYALIMERIEGITLNQYIKNYEKFENYNLSKIFLKTVKTLLYLGIKLKIYHGDIHLNNIMVSEKKYKEKVYIIDFANSNISDDIVLDDFEDFIDILRRKIYSLCGEKIINTEDEREIYKNLVNLLNFLQHHDHNKFYNKCSELIQYRTKLNEELHKLIYLEFKKNYDNF